MADKSTFDYAKLILENVAVWEVVLVIGLIWIWRQPELLKKITCLKIGELEIELQQLREEVNQSKETIQELEENLESEKRLFGELLESFNPEAPLSELAPTRDLLKAHARSIENPDDLRQFLHRDVLPGELYAAAVALRERRPVPVLPDMIQYLDWLAADSELRGIRLNTVWTLTSAFHLTLIAAIRDKVEPGVEKETLYLALPMLDKLEKNPRVQGDRPDAPKKGILGPLNHARKWVEKGLMNGDK
ncbi:hypothetical protein NF212_19110 [Parasalinivibrio latis]|uniref:hypothetical protein n=1 Tax=Parasalinivibrio latis TaxID=2952610 RepID=UPI0030E513E9